MGSATVLKNFPAAPEKGLTWSALPVKLNLGYLERQRMDDMEKLIT